MVKAVLGKTTIAACLARLIGRDGYNVIAVDADPGLNLASALRVRDPGIKPFFIR